MSLPNVERPGLLPRLHSTWVRGSDFLANYVSSPERGVFFHPIGEGAEFPPACEVGAKLSVLIFFEDRDASFHVHAEVLARLEEGHRRGLQLGFYAEEAPREKMVVACAEGEAFPYVRRRYDRVPCYFPVRVITSSDQRFDAVVKDISEGGARLVMGAVLNRGERVRLWLQVPNKEEGMWLSGKVIYSMSDPQHRVVGIKFEFGSVVELDELVGQVELLRRRHRGGR